MGTPFAEMCATTFARVERAVERKSGPADLRAGVTKTWRMVNILWLQEIVVVLAAWVVLPLVLSRRSGSGDVSGVISLLFYAVGLADLVAGWWLRERAFAAARRMAAQSADAALGRIVGASLFAVPMAVTPAILGVVFYLTFGDRVGLSVLCVLSLIGLALHRPRFDQWQAILSTAGIDAHRPA
ncbi:MAG: hypothetical protein ACT4PY_09920 [Armatimonadota bacterium]